MRRSLPMIFSAVATLAIVAAVVGVLLNNARPPRPLTRQPQPTVTATTPAQPTATAAPTEQATII